MKLSHDQLRVRVRETHQIFSAILDLPNLDAIGRDRLDQLTKAVNACHAQARSFEHEYLRTTSALQKGRSVITQTHADVTVGAADALFAKSIECKTVTTPEKTSVDFCIREAMNQLGGGTGHQPRAGDVRVIDVFVQGSENPWPVTGGAYGARRVESTLEELRGTGVRELRRLLKDADSTGAKALMAWLMGEDKVVTHRLNNLPSANDAAQFRNSTRPVAVDAQDGIQKIRCLSVKIRYDPPYPIASPLETEELAVNYLVFQVYRQHRDIQIEDVKSCVLKIQFDSVPIPGTSWIGRGEETGRQTTRYFHPGS